MSSHPSTDGAAHLRLATGEESRGAPAPCALRVTLVDDDALVMAGFQALLSPYTARVEATCSRGVPTELTDVALFDCFAAPEAGWATLARLRDTATVTRLVVYTNDPPQAHVGALTDFGVAGILTKHATADELVTALERVARGERAVDPAFPVELGDDWWPGRRRGAHRARGAGRHAHLPRPAQRRDRERTQRLPQHAQELHPLRLPHHGRRLPQRGGAVGRRARTARRRSPLSSMAPRTGGPSGSRRFTSLRVWREKR
nr:hypothetical protein [Dermacoccus barathri]